MTGSVEVEVEHKGSGGFAGRLGLPIDPMSRGKTRWDLFVFLVIAVAAFEVPYSLVVGWENDTTRIAFDLFFYFVFWLDLVLSFLTIRERSYAGFLDWRHFLAFRWELSPEYARLVRAKKLADAGLPPDPVFVERLSGRRGERTIWKEYMSSKWFWIDLMSAIPFELVSEALGFNLLARTTRLARIPRVLRLMRTTRLLRISRTVKLMGMRGRYRSLTVSHPAHVRFVALFTFTPWFIHISACLLCVESGGVPDAGMYLGHLHDVFIAMTSAQLPETRTAFGEAVGMIVMFGGLLFFGSFVGNFATLFSSVDEAAVAAHREKKRWVEMFWKYPEVFDWDGPELKVAILTELQRGRMESRASDEVELIRGLGADLEGRVVAAIHATLAERCQLAEETCGKTPPARNQEELQHLANALELTPVTNGEVEGD